MSDLSNKPTIGPADRWVQSHVSQWKVAMMSEKNSMVGSVRTVNFSLAGYVQTVFSEMEKVNEFTPATF